MEKLYDLKEGNYIDKPQNIKDFLAEFDLLCKRHDLSFTHEDPFGEFIIENYKEEHAYKLNNPLLNVEKRKRPFKRELLTLVYQTGLSKKNTTKKQMLTTKDQALAECEKIAQDEQVTYVAIEKVDTVIKDIRGKVMIKNIASLKQRQAQELNSNERIMKNTQATMEMSGLKLEESEINTIKECLNGEKLFDSEVQAAIDTYKE